MTIISVFHPISELHNRCPCVVSKLCEARDRNAKCSKQVGRLCGFFEVGPANLRCQTSACSACSFSPCDSPSIDLLPVSSKQRKLSMKPTPRKRQHLRCSEYQRVPGNIRKLLFSTVAPAFFCAEAMHISDHFGSFWIISHCEADLKAAIEARATDVTYPFVAFSMSIQT